MKRTGVEILTNDTLKVIQHNCGGGGSKDRYVLIGQIFYGMFGTRILKK